ncbi:MAG: putative quinol monooxygenase [Minwuia sp.]|nr:putative quinol monooxygenase [Minwuia sp.]
MTKVDAMIVVSGPIRVAADSREAAQAAMIEVAAETRKEAGCISYAFYADLTEAGAFRVFEEWESDAALKAHSRAPHMIVFREKLAGLEFISREIGRYVVTETTNL